MFGVRSANGILDAFGVKIKWEEWRETAVREYSKTDKRSRRLRWLEKARSVRASAYHFRDVKKRKRGQTEPDNES